MANTKTLDIPDRGESTSEIFNTASGVVVNTRTLDIPYRGFPDIYIYTVSGGTTTLSVNVADSTTITENISATVPISPLTINISDSITVTEGVGSLGTFGTTSEAGTTAGGVADVIVGTKYTLAVNATINSLSFYSNLSGNAKIGIYSDNSGAPNSLLVTSAGTATTGGQWNTISITPTYLTAGTYWIAVIANVANRVWIAGGTNQSAYNLSTSYTIGLPATFPTPTYQNNDYISYGSYTTPGGIILQEVNNINVYDKSTVRDYRRNYTLNPSFETADAWEIRTNGAGGISTLPSSDYSYSGSNSIKIINANSTDTTYLRQIITVVPGHTYTFSAYVKVTNYVSNISALRIQDTSFSTLVASSNISSVQDWTRYSCTYTVPFSGVPGGSPIQIQLICDWLVGTYYFDAVLFEESNSADSYFDGSLYNCGWDGSANNSTSSTITGTLSTSSSNLNINIFDSSTIVESITSSIPVIYISISESETVADVPSTPLIPSLKINLADYTRKVDQTQGNSNQSYNWYGTGGTAEAIGQSFTPSYSGYLVGFTAMMKKLGSPTDDVIVSVYSDTMGGTLIGSRRVPGNIMSVSTFGANFTFYFNTPISVTSGTKYYVSITRSGDRDAVNYYMTRWQSSNDYANGGIYTLGSGSWSSESTTSDISFSSIMGGVFESITAYEPAYNVIIADSTSIIEQSIAFVFTFGAVIVSESTIISDVADAIIPSVPVSVSDSQSTTEKVFIFLNNSGFLNIDGDNIMAVQGSGDSWSAIADGVAYLGQGQSFTTGTIIPNISKIRYVAQWHWAYGPPAGNDFLYLKLWTVTGDLPNTLVATSSVFYRLSDIERADGGGNPNNTVMWFDFFPRIQLDVNTKYCFTLELSNSFTGTYLDGLTNSTGGYADGRLIRKDTAGIWSTAGVYDGTFEVHDAPGIIDSTTIIETVALEVKSYINISDNCIPSDVITIREPYYTLNISDSITATDIITVRGLVLLVNISDSTTITESRTTSIIAPPNVINIFDSTTTLDTTTVGELTYVVTSGGQFKVGANRFRYIGVNNYPLVKNEYNSTQIDSFFADCNTDGIPVVRMWAYGTEGNSTGNFRYINGTTLYWREAAFVSLDTVLDSAKRHGVRVVLVLTDQYSYGPDKGNYCAWSNAIYSTAYATNPGDDFHTDSNIIGWFEEFINKIVTRTNTINGRLYRQDDTIMSYELGNELRYTSGTDTNINTASSFRVTTLKMWYDTISTYIKSIDSYHLVGTGSVTQFYNWVQDDSIHNGSYYGLDYTLDHQLGNIDYFDFHIYPYGDYPDFTMKAYGQSLGYTGIVPSYFGFVAQLNEFVSLAKSSGKPIVMHEEGVDKRNTIINPYPAYPRDNHYRNLFSNFFNLDADGINIWHYSNLLDDVSYNIKPDGVHSGGNDPGNLNTDDTTLRTEIRLWNQRFPNNAAYSEFVTDAEIITETVIVSSGRSLFITDSSSISDIPTVFIPYYKASVSESITISDVPVVSEAFFLVNIIESEIVSDIPVVRLINNLLISDSITVFENITLDLSPKNINTLDSITVKDYRRNLVPNPSFEVNNTGWANEQGARVTSDSYSGIASESFIATSAWGNFWQTSAMNVAPYTDYTLSFYYKMTVNSGNAPRVQVLNNTSWTIAYKDLGLSAQANWTRFTTTFNTGNNTQAVIRFYNNNGNVSGLFDSFQMEVGSIATPYIDGSIPLASWDGTANNSSSTTAIDNIVLGQVNNINIAEPISVSEAVTLLQARYVLSVFDTVILTESIVLSEKSYINVLDLTSPLDVPNVFIPYLKVSLADSTIIVESANVSAGQGVYVFDSSTIIDVPALRLPYYVLLISDSISVVDNLIVFEPYYALSISDSTTVSESVSISLKSYISISDSTTINDAITLYINYWLVNASDSTTTNELVIAKVLSYINIFDTETVTESVTLRVFSYINISDSTTTSELIILSGKSSVSVSDSSTITEATTTAPVSNVNILEPISTIDTPIVRPMSNLAVFDTTGIGETVILNIGVKINVWDSTLVQELYVVIVDLLIDLADSTSILEYIELEVSTSLRLSTYDSIIIADVVNLYVTWVIHRPISGGINDRLEIVMSGFTSEGISTIKSGNITESLSGVTNGLVTETIEEIKSGNTANQLSAPFNGFIDSGLDTEL